LQDQKSYIETFGNLVMRTLILVFVLILNIANADILQEWQGSNENSTVILDHSSWQSFLNRYLAKDDFGQTYFAYSKVSREEAGKLRTYIRRLESIDPLSLNSDEQKAYWFNLYNAVTVNIVLEAYPVESIRDIGSRFGGLVKSGPWKLKVVTVNGKELSLDDIEHGIVRPKFNDYRIHFAVNCASMGCPNLATTAYSGVNIEQLLSEAEQEFINHPRGVRIQNGKLIVSKIFDWYMSDFVDNEDDLPEFLAQVAEPKLRAQLKGYSGSIKYEYDWSLNEVLNNE
jgi:hypothetical protein